VRVKLPAGLTWEQLAAMSPDEIREKDAVQTAMAGRMPFTMLRDAIFTHPTVSSEGLVFLLGHVERREG